MKLLDLQNGETNVWEEKGYLLPKYDREGKPDMGSLWCR